MIRRLLFLPALFLGALAQPGGAQVRFADRTIDLSAHIRYMVARRYTATPDVPGLYVEVREPGSIRLRHIPDSVLSSGAPIDLRTLPVSFPAIDLSRSNAGTPQRNPLTGAWTVSIDSASDERYDVHELLDQGRTLRRVTRSGLVQAHSAAGGLVAVIERDGAAEPYGRCLSLINFATLRRAKLLCADATRLFDSQLVWRPDGKVLIAAGRMFRISGDSAVSERTLTSETVVAWLDTTRYLSLRTSGRARSMFEVETAGGTAQQLTALASFGQPRPDVRSIDGKLLAFLSDGRSFTAVDLRTSTRVGSVTLPEGFSVSTPSGRHWVLSRTSTAHPPEYALLTARLSGDSLAFTVKGLPSDVVVPQGCTVERVSYPTFDGTITGYLYSPLRPLPDARDRLGLVEAYYGGGGGYHSLASLFCEAGVTTLSPAISRNTYADRGGDEIVDAIFGARWLRDRLGVQERQIGTFGTSQGGYNAMRLMTFQPETNGRNVGFDFGFAISMAGYSSMLTILGNTNTESPFIIATGNPATEAGRARLRERSPLDQVARLRAPLLLLHGTSDNRVRIAESHQMLKAARAAGKDVTLVQLPGEGHRAAIEENQRTYLKAQLEFLERVRAELHRQSR